MLQITEVGDLNFIRYVNYLGKVSHRAYVFEGEGENLSYNLIFPIFDQFQDLKPVLF